MSKLVEAIANTVKADQGKDWIKYGTRTVTFDESGVRDLGCFFMTFGGGGEGG
ncbi:beta-class phenol-soluble modulin, partial [Staphylococcus epidermidis]|uniref:beta-class phenol-soluble modulin n=1 Tax=Staphylococcus epidermidis TaxID=1282 RepID=UPI0037488A17